MLTITISDSTSIIALARAQKLQLLKDLFGQVLIPEGVYQELAIKGKGKAGAEEVERGQIFIREGVKSQDDVNRLTGRLSQADAEVIILAKEKKADAILTDDSQILDEAEKEKILAITTRRILLEAKRRGFLASVKETMDEMRRQGIGIRDDVYEDTLRQAGETP